MKKFVFLLASICIISSATAHEYVIMAYQFMVKQGDNLELHLFVADGFNIQLEKPFQKAITKKFELINENGKINLLEKMTEGTFPLGNFKVDFKGLGLFSMERNYAEISLPNKKFLSYLKEDNIENITIENSSKTEQKEKYTRYIKTLIQSDFKKNDSIYKTVIGSKFEIVLLDNPYQMKKGARLEAKILFDGKPLINKVITARNRNGNEAASVQYSRTDKNGICAFKLNREGDWFIHVTHMIPFPDKKQADWESFWATYSFGFSN